MDGAESVESLVREAKGKYAVGKRKDAYRVYVRALECILQELKNPAITGDDASESAAAREAALKSLSTARTCLDEAGQIVRALGNAPVLAPAAASLPASSRSAPAFGSTLPLPPLKPPRLPPMAEAPEAAISTVSATSEESTPPTSSVMGTPPHFYPPVLVEKPKPKPPLPPKPMGPLLRGESFTSSGASEAQTISASNADGATSIPKLAPATVSAPVLPNRSVSAGSSSSDALKASWQPPRVTSTTNPARPPVPPPIIAIPPPAGKLESQQAPETSLSQESIRSLRDSGSLDGEDLDLPPVSPSSASPTLMTTTLRPKSVPGRLEGNLEAQLAAPVVVRPASSYSTQLQKKPAIPKSMLVKWHSDFVQQLDQVSRDLKQLQTAKIRRHSDSEAMDSAEQLAATGSGEAGVLSSSNYLFHAASPDPNNISHLKGLKATLEFRAGRVLHLIDMARRTTLLQLKAYHMAHQLSILEQSLFLQIKPQDLLNHHPPHNSNPAIQAQTDFFNFVARVVEHSILSEPNVGNRARAIHQWAKVSQHLLQIRNVQSLRAVSAAMQTPPVARLKKTWAIVPTKSMKSIEQIRSLLSEQNNYYVYREWCARGGGINIADILGSAPAAMGPGGGSSHGHASSSTGRLPRPAVPFFGVYIHDTYYLMAALKKERVAGPSGTLDNETILKDRRMQEIVDQIVYYQSGGTYAPVSAGKGDLALSTGSRDSSKESLHLRDGGSLAMGVLRGIGSATVNLARRSAKPSSVGISDGPVSASASGTPPMGMTAVVPGTVEDQLKEMDDETASMFTQHWILSREWYTEKDVDDLSVQREPKAEDDGHSMHFSYGNGSAGTSERVTSSVISTTSTSTGGTLVDRDRDRDRDSIVSSHFGYRDSIASDVSLGDLAEASTSIGAGTPGPKKSWSLKKMMKDIGGGFNASGRPESIAAEVINEAFIGDDERREEKRRSGGEITDGRQRRSMGAGPTPRELMAQAGRTLAERRTFAGYDNPPLELSTDSSLDSSPFASPVNSRPTSTVSTPNQSLDDIEPSPGPLPIRSRASRSPERDLSSSVGSVTGVEARRLSHFPAGSSVGSDLGTSPTSAPSVGKAPFGVRFEKGAREGDLNSDSMSTGTHQRTQSAGRLSGWPPGAFGYTISVPKPADSASLPADKALLARRSTAQASVAGGAPSAPSATGERPRSIAVIGTKAAGGAPAASAYSTATPAVNESASDKRKPIRGFALPGMAPSVPP